MATQMTVAEYEELILQFRTHERAQMGEFDYFTKYPERFADEILGIDLMKDMSEMNEFRGFTSFQIEFMHDFLDADIPNLFLRCNRGGAKSFLICYCAVLDIYRHDCNNHRWDIPILAGSERQAGEAYRKYAKKMIKNSPVLNQLAVPQKRTAIFRRTESQLMILAASQTDVKGPRAKVQIIDEICSTPEDVIEEYWGEMITAPAWKCVIAGTPDDPGHVSYEWEHDPKHDFKTHHWSAYDCLVEKGGWLFPKTVEQMKKKYKSIHAIRRNVLGEWSSYGGSIIRQEDIDAATNDYFIPNLPDPASMEYFVIGSDPARSNHYSTFVTLGIKAGRVYIYNAQGYQNITEKSMRTKILREAERCLNYLGAEDFGPVYVIVEDAPISKALCDNLERECAVIGCSFSRSRFGSASDSFGAKGTKKKLMKNRFVENMCYFFEERLIKIPKDFTLLIGELISLRWKKLAGKTDDFTTGTLKKGKDDFVDALMHGLYKVTRRFRARRKKTTHIVVDDRKPKEYNVSREMLEKQQKRKEKVGSFVVMVKRSNYLDG